MIQHDLHSAAYPTLDPRQRAELARCAGGTRRRRYSAGQTLFQAGDRDVGLLLVETGEVAIVEPAAGSAVPIAIHGPGQFTGDVSHVTGGVPAVSAVARTDCEVHEVPSSGLRDVLERCPELAEVVLQAFIARRQLRREASGFTGPRVLGSRHSRDTRRIRDFLARNRVPFTWIDLEEEPHVDHLLQRFGLREEQTPVVAWGTQVSLRNPSDRELAEALGVGRPLQHRVYDLAVVGAGPAGLAAAAYAATEGLSTVVLERRASESQSASSTRIENYLGFPTGIGANELTDCAVVQAERFGARITIITPVVSVSFEGGYPILHLESGETVSSRCMLIATGADYRKLDVDGCARFEGSGVHYAATPSEAVMCRGSDVVVVGGGTSAGEAAIFLRRLSRRVYLVLRGESLYKDMSSHLARRIESAENIEVLLRTTVRRMIGQACLSAVEVVTEPRGEARTIETPAVFSFIGAVPRTDWLCEQIAIDDKGFIRTGPGPVRSPFWNRRREPFLLETNRPGVFAAGDVRSGSLKRVASAVGEGAMTVKFVHECMQER